jgi:uncharacterized protein YjbI with pentapeptide repeats
MRTILYSSNQKRKFSLLTSLIALLFCALCSTTLYAQDQEAYVETDAPDYAPGSTVIIAGEYWTPGETVYLKVTHLSPLPVPDVTGVTPNPYDVWTVIADANGEVHATWYVNDFEAGAQLQLEAYTDSGYDYRTFFTDAPDAGSGDGTMSVTPITACSNSIVPSITFTFTNNTTKDFKYGSQLALVIPAGWTAPQKNSSSNPGYISLSGSAGTKTIYSITGTGPWTILINMVCSSLKTVVITYGGGSSSVTVPTVTSPADYKFASQSKSKGNGTLTDLTAGSPSVTVNPTSMGGTATSTSSTICSGSSTSISLSSYTGSIQWQQSADGSTGWANITGGSGGTTATYTTPNLTATTYYRAFVTSGVCASVNSSVASVTVNSAPSITTQPSSPPITYGGNASFTLVASGTTPLSYKWQVNSGSGFNDISDGSVYSGSSTATLILSKPNVAMSGYKYQCVVSNDCGSVNSSAATLTVTKADLTVVNTDRSKVYGVTLTNADYTGSITGIQAGDNITITRASSGDAANATVAGSTYPIVGTLVDPDSRLANYTVSNPNGALTVTKADLTVVNTDRSKVYGVTLTNADYTGSITGIQASDNITITRASTGDAANATVAGSTYPIVGTLVDPDSRLANYNVTNPDGALTVTKADLTVVNTDRSKVYGVTLTNADYTGSITGIQAGDNITITRASSGDAANATVAGSTYPIVGTLVDPNGRLANYNVTNPDGALTVGQKAISVTANDGQTKLYGSIDPILTYQITSGSLVNGDVLNGQLGRISGENVGSYLINQGTLANSNYSIIFIQANFTITPLSVVVTPNSEQSKKYGSSDPVLLYSTSPALLPNGNTVSLNGSLARNPGENVGSYAILQNNIVTANNPNYTITFTGGIMFAITPSSVTATVTMNKDSVQYSDVAVFTATLTGGAPLLTGGPQAATSATFYVGTQSMGTANLTVNGNDLVATLTATLLETTADQMMPGNKTLKVNFNGINSNYDVPASKTSNVIITRENAIVSYSGVQFASTSGISSSSAIVTLAVTIQDITATYDPRYDAYPGDIRKAKVRFMNMDSNTPITGWLPVALISSNDLKTGTVMYDWTTDIGSNDALQFTLGVQVDGYYVGTSDNTIVTIAKPLDNFVTGGGNLLLTNAVSGTKDGDIGSKLNFGFNVKYDAAKNELKGHFNAIIFRTEDQWGRKCMPNHGVLHQLKIDGDDMISLAVVPATSTSPAIATFTGKLDVRDNQHSNILFANGATVMVTMTDCGEPGKNDKLGITIWNPDGSLLFSSSWGLVRTAEQKLNDGNLEIHSKVVFKTGSLLPTVNLEATPTFGVKGTPITFNVTVKGSKSVPTGSVTFKDNTTGAILTTVLLSNGSATFTTSSLGVGTHDVDAYYGGNNTYKSGVDDATIEITMPSNSSVFNSEHADSIDLNVYPNPFGSHLFLKLQTPEDTHALLEVFDISGRKIAVVVDQTIIGNQLYTFEYVPAGNVVPGMLIYRLTVGQKVYMGKVIYQPR